MTIGCPFPRHVLYVRRRELGHGVPDAAVLREKSLRRSTEAGDHFKEYLQLPRSEGQGATALITGLEDGMQGLDMDETEIASQLLLV